MFDMNKMSDKVFKEPNLVRTLITKRADVEYIGNPNDREMYYKISAHDEAQEIGIFSELDKLVKCCCLTSENAQILSFVYKGYTFREISKKLNIDNSNVSKRLNTICKKIVKEYRLQITKEEAKKAKAYFKKCTKCGENLPELLEFFAYDKTNQCYKSSCKKCRKG